MAVLIFISIFIPAVGAAVGEARQRDEVVDEDGNRHMIYSQGGDVYYKNNIGCGNMPWNRWNEPVRLTDMQMPAYHPRIEISDGFIYGVWVQKYPEMDRFVYAGALLEEPDEWGLNIDVAKVPVDLNGDRYEMEVETGTIMLSWNNEVKLSWTADIDGDMIPDLEDERPLEYDVVNDFVDFESDVVSVVPELDVSVAVDFEGDEYVLPTITEVDGDFEHSVGRYINIELDTEDSYKALVKFGYGWLEESNPYLRLYRENSAGWSVVTDWEEDEYTGANTEHDYSWALINGFSTFTLAPANEIDGDGDGLADLTEGTEPEELSKMVYTADNFNKIELEGFEDTTYLQLSLSEYGIYTTVRGYIELSVVDEPVEDLQLDIGGDGKINWRASMPLDGSIRVGTLSRPINVYIFENHLNTAGDSLGVPLVFRTSNGVPFQISNANIEVEQRITWNYEVDTSGDGLWDGWQDISGDMNYVREGADGILGTDDDNIPGALSYGLDPMAENTIGGTGRLAHNVYHEGMSSVNAASGNLMLEETDLGFDSLAFDIYARRTYNSQSTNVGPLGPGWHFNFDQRLEFDEYDPVYIDESGAEHKFANNEDGTYTPEVGNPYSLVAKGLPEAPLEPGLEASEVSTIYIVMELTQVAGAAQYEVRINGDSPQILEHDPDAEKITFIWTGLESGTKYTVSGKSIDRYGQASAWAYMDVWTSLEGPMMTSSDDISKDNSLTLYEDEVEYIVRDTDGTKRYFDEEGLLKRIEDRNGNKLFFDYDESGNLIKTYDDTGKRLSLWYEDGRLSSVTDPMGRTVRYYYDSAGRLSEYHDALGQTYRYTYDDTGLLHKVYKPSIYEETDTGTVEVWLYTEYRYVHEPVEGMLKEVREGYYYPGGEKLGSIRQVSSFEYEYPSHTFYADASGNETLNVFNEDGAQIKHENPDDTNSSFDYDGELNLIDVVDKKGNEWKAEYGPLGTPTEQFNPLNRSESMKWEISDTQEEYITVETERTDESGNKTFYEYDDDYNLVRAVERTGVETVNEYDAFGQLVRTVDGIGGEWLYEYDGYGNLIKEVDPVSAVTLHEYDAVNRKVRTIEPNGAATEYIYDELDRQVKVVDTYGNTEEYVYDSADNLVRYTDRLGATTVYEYDHYGRMIADIDALGGTVTYVYDERDNVIEEINRRGFPTYRKYDEMNRLVYEADRWGNNETYEYDEFGNMVVKTDKLGNEWTYEYDELGMQIGEYNPLGYGTKYDYDAVGNLIHETDAMGFATEYEYDAEGRSLRSLGAEGSEVLYEYDAVGNLLTVIQMGDDVNSTWRYEYDLMGRKVKEITPLGLEYTWDYDEMNNVVRYETPSGDVTTYEYDLLNRLTHVELPGDIKVDMTYTLFTEEREEYDYPIKYVIHVYPPPPEYPDPPMMSVIDREVDLLGRTIKESWTFGERVDGEVVPEDVNYTISYVYDEEGNVIEVNDQFGNVTYYGYDCRNRLRNVTDPEGYRTEYIYDAANRLIETVYPIGTRILRDYDAANRLTSIANVRSDDTIISAFAYEHDANGRRTSMTEANGDKTTYNYDGEGRLTTVVYSDGSATGYTYDRRGNIVERTFYHNQEVISNLTSEHDEENRLLNMGDSDYEYDAKGNQIVGDTEYIYLSTYLNGEKINLLAHIGTLPPPEDDDTITSAGDPIVSYGYTMDGRRIGKAGDVDVRYLYDGQNVVYEMWGDGSKVRYTHPLAKYGQSSCAGDSCGAGVCGPTAHMFIDAPISITVDGVKYYYLYDGLGSVTELIDEDENVVNLYRYTPFGESMLKIEGVFNPYQYTGRRYDQETGQYYYRARMYSPSQGRFLSNDPLGMVDGPNMYAYVQNDPVNHRDPTGMFRWRVLRRWWVVYGYEADFTYSESVHAAFNIRITIPLCLKTPMPLVCIAISSAYYTAFWYCSSVKNKGTRIGWTILGGALYPPKCISYY